MPTSSEKSQDQKAACHKETPYKFDAVICPSKGQAEFYVISQQFIKPGWVQTLNRNSALRGAWIPAFDCHKAGRLPSGSHSGSLPQLLVTCHTLFGRWQHFNSNAIDPQAVANGFKVFLGIVSCFPKELTPSSSRETEISKELGYKEIVEFYTSYSRYGQFQRKYL